MTFPTLRIRDRADLLWPLGIFVVLVILKLVFVTGRTTGATISDEDVYWNLSKILYDGIVYQGTKYPPIYPLALLPAHLFGDGAYRAALTLNAVYSSLLVFPVYAIGKLLTERRLAIFVTVLTALIPFHYVLSRTLMSENVYFPLLFLAVWMVIYRPKRGLVWFDLLTGVVIGGLYLTRFVTLVVLPAFAIAWWLREWQHVGRWYLDKRAWGRAAVACVGFIVVFGPWIWIERGYGLSISSALGFGVASITNPEQLTAGRLWLYVRMYLAYFVLIATPVVGMVALVPGQVMRKRVLNVYTRFAALSMVLSVSYLAGLSRHSWRAAYNYPDPMRIMGRYAIYLAVIFMLLAFAALYRWHRDGGLLRHGLTTLVIPLGLVTVSYLTVLDDWVLPMTERMITDRGSVDAFRIMLMGPWFWVIGLSTIVGVSLTLWLKGRRAAGWVAFLGTALFLVIGAPTYIAHMEDHQVYIEHAHEIVEVATDLDIEPPIDVVVTEAVQGATGFPYYIVLSGMRLNVRFPEKHHVRVYLETSENARVPHIIVKTEEESLAGADVLATYEIDGIGYVIERNPDAGAP